MAYPPSTRISVDHLTAPLQDGLFAFSPSWSFWKYGKIFFSRACYFWGVAEEA